MTKESNIIDGLLKFLSETARTLEGGGNRWSGGGKLVSGWKSGWEVEIFI